MPRLDATTIPKYEEALAIPPVMPPAAPERVPEGVTADEDYYEIVLRQFEQPVLPASMGLTTTVWGYTEVDTPSSMHSPACTIEARFGRPVTVKWVNGLVDEAGHFLPHLLPVDPALHWANPGGGELHRDHDAEFDGDEVPAPYDGPVPMVVHLHGGSTADYCDGHFACWYLPAAADLPDGFAEAGTMYAEFARTFWSGHGQQWEPGAATFRYDNQQAATTLWFHDHTMGMTRLNTYAGPAGFYLIRGGDADVEEGILPGPAPRLNDPPGTAYHEIPIAIQDRSFFEDGSLFYPDSRAFFDEFEGPYVPESDIAPIFNPEVFGDTLVVNGHTWPVLDVEPRRYRFRFLNGCNARFLMLKLVDDAQVERPASAMLPFHQIGADSGFLASVATLNSLLLAPSERADVIVDFTGLAEGTELYLINEGPDEPFGGGSPGKEFAAANPETTGQVMKIVVGKLVSDDRSSPIDEIELPQPVRLGPSGITRRLALVELDSEVLEGIGPRKANLGIVGEDGKPIPMDIDDPLTEAVTLEAAEIWELYNFTEDAHPIHIHEVQFEIVNRERFLGDVRPPEVWESGRKDTVIAYPEEITRVKIRFLHPGLFVWHCHILEHEDHEMMRPIRVLG
jgi:spore coat protein A, manganese oxidase